MNLLAEINLRDIKHHRVSKVEDDYSFLKNIRRMMNNWNFLKKDKNK